MQIDTLNNLPSWFPLLLIVLLIWEAVWKGIALWKAAKHNQLPWFLCIFIFNTLGILPILYIKFFQRKQMPLKV
jgi:hypothetical protein